MKGRRRLGGAPVSEGASPPAPSKRSLPGTDRKPEETHANARCHRCTGHWRSYRRDQSPRKRALTKNPMPDTRSRLEYQLISATVTPSTQRDTCETLTALPGSPGLLDLADEHRTPRRRCACGAQPYRAGFVRHSPGVSKGCHRWWVRTPLIQVIAGGNSSGRHSGPATPRRLESSHRRQHRAATRPGPCAVRPNLLRFRSSVGQRLSTVPFGRPDHGGSRATASDNTTAWPPARFLIKAFQNRPGPVCPYRLQAPPLAAAQGHGHGA